MENIYEILKNKKGKIAVIGLGYVGLPLAVEFAKYYNVIGFDLNKSKIESYKNGFDVTCEVGNENLKKSNVVFTSNENDLDNVIFYIVAVPTPINFDKTPDLFPVESASEVVSRHISKNAICVFESTVYPGVTEDVCGPIIEKGSGLIHNIDFYLGYSPERINPSDKVHRVWNIKKIVSGSNEYICDQIALVYGEAIKAGVFKTSNIKTAEAIKVVENSQRDVNIAFMNEIAMVFEKMGIDTSEVIDGMNTKWNALGFRPGLVGGHCIGVDPYYFIYQAENLGYHSQIIQSGRKINDGMAEFIVNVVLRKLVINNYNPCSSKILILGASFKENCNDIRNSKVFDIYNGLISLGVNVKMFDDNVSVEEVKKNYNVDLLSRDELVGFDAIILAVAHDSFKSLDLNRICNNTKNPILFDLKNFSSNFDIKEFKIWKL